MLLPATTGSGASALEMPSNGADVTVVVASGPVAGRLSLLSSVQPVLVMTVPDARGLLTFTTSCTDPGAPAASAPTFQVTTPAASVPPPVADTKVVFTGIGSVITTPVALFVP